MNSTVQFVKSIALSGNSGAIVVSPVDPLQEYFEIRCSAFYAAVAGTTGVSMAITTTLADGATVPVQTVVCPGVAATLTSVIARSANRSLNGTIVGISVTLTNLDGTNAVACALDIQGHRE